MKASRRAVSPTAQTVVGALVVALGSALAGVGAVLGVVAARMARRVVTPSGRVPDTRILDVDVAAQTITLGRTPDTALPGRYGLFTSGTASYLKLGSVLTSDDAGVKRKLLTRVDERSSLAADAAFSGWYYTRPEELHLPYEPELVRAPVGGCPAWIFPAETPTDTWVVQIHGRGTARAECLRAVAVFRDAGITSLLVSYRNDGEAPRSPGGAYGLGGTEWRDVDAALTVARRRGARRIVLMGWSMGGAIALQVALNSDCRDLVAGIVLESPVLDWRRVLAYQAEVLRLPVPVTGLAIRALGAGWATALTGAESAIEFDRLDIVARAAELRHPILLLHSDDDGFVPSDASHDLVVARPDLVEMAVFDAARHTKLWNYDEARWTRTIRQWLDRHGLAGEPTKIEE